MLAYPLKRLQGIEGKWVDGDQEMTTHMDSNGKVKVIPVEPQTKDFLLIAHCTWALLFGYLGGKYGAWIARRQEAHEKREQEKVAA